MINYYISKGKAINVHGYNVLFVFTFYDDCRNFNNLKK